MLFPLSTISGAQQAVVLLHGIQQSAGHVFDFGHGMSSPGPPAFDVYTFGYDWRLSIAYNGQLLANALASLPHERLDLVGYSMGGLVARIAAVRGGGGQRLQTIITLATPNRGALRTSDLSALGQAAAGLAMGAFVSPLPIRAPGIADLLRVDDLMAAERATIVAAGGANPVAGKRYASIPALFFHANRSVMGFGPSGLMNAARLLAGKSLARPHDGIVREPSADLTGGGSADWAEFDLCDEPAGTHPPLCHAVLQGGLDEDHISILSYQGARDLVRRMVLSANWTDLAADPAIVRTTKVTLARPR